MGFILVMFGFISCGSDSSCDEDSLFTLERAEGNILYLPCYDSWAIRIEDTDEGTIIAASLTIPEEFQEQDLVVCVDACFHSFDLPLRSSVPTVIAETTMFVMQNYRLEKK